jgi:hypothetical protein
MLPCAVCSVSAAKEAKKGDVEVLGTGPLWLHTHNTAAGSNDTATDVQQQWPMHSQKITGLLLAAAAADDFLCSIVQVKIVLSLYMCTCVTCNNEHEAVQVVLARGSLQRIL